MGNRDSITLIQSSDDVKSANSTSGSSTIMEKVKVALVTGSTSGIGLACAHSLAKRGVHLIITGFGDESIITTTVEECKREYSVNVHYVPADLRKKVDEIQKLCDDVFKLYPDGIDILINNAGMQHVCPVDEYPDDKWNELIAVMLTAPFQLTKRFLPAMKKKGWGRIVNISSQLALVSIPGKAVYSAAKTGLVGLTKGVALETASSGVTCNAVCPGFTRSPVFTKQIADRASTSGISLAEAESFMTSHIPTKTLNTVDQVAELVEFLCLSNASSQMTGATYLIDQGYTAQ